jgi:hypothetical protein
MPAYLSPIGNSQIVDVNGNPLNGGKIYTYLAGTSTPAGTWTTSAGAIAQTNPIILNSLGATANPIFLSAGVAYKFIIKDSTDVTTLYTFDNITGINDPSQVALSTPEWMPATFAISYVSGTVFSATGDQTLTLPVGMRVKTTNTGGTAYSRVLSSVFSLGFTTVTLLNDSLALDSGLSALSYSILSPTKPSLPNSQAARDSLGVPNGIAKNLLKNASFFVNQDSYINFTPLAALAFGHDCWRAGAGGCTYAATAGLQDCNITAGTLLQTVETPSSLRAGDKLVLSGFSGTAQIGATASGISPLIYTHNGDPTIFISLPVGYHQKLQFEIGTNPTSFEQVSPQQDIANCQRFHVRVTGIDGITGWGSGRQSSTTGSRIWINPPVPMYAKPTVVFSGVQLDYSGGITAATASTVYSSKNQVMMDVTHAAVGAAGAGVGLQIPNGVANYIEFNARL